MKTLFLAAAAALFVAAPAQATPKSFYFNCGGTTPITNVTEPPLTWSATAPATAFSAGGGCLSADYEMLDASFGGSYAGEVKALDLVIYGAYSNPVYRQLLNPSLNVSITVDGTSVFEGTELPTPNEAAGPLPGGFKASFTIPDLDIPVSATPKSYVINVTNPYVDDSYVLARGASDLASGITFYAQEDLPEPEPEEGF